MRLTISAQVRYTSGGKEENVKLRDIVVPRLHPEQQIRQEEEVQTPPRREPRRNEGDLGL